MSKDLCDPHGKEELALSLCSTILHGFFSWVAVGLFSVLPTLLVVCLSSKAECCTGHCRVLRSYQCISVLGNVCRVKRRRVLLQTW